jgi:zinc transport system substrate-binding protein
MNKKNTISIFVVAVFILSIFVFFMSGTKKFYDADKRSAGRSSKLQVAASFYPLYYFASTIGGEKAEVYDITPAGAEPHDYEPTPQDIVHMENSRLLILNGGGLESWSDSVKQNLASSNIVVITAGEGLATHTIPGERNNISDPHVWLSPVLAEEMADKIADGFKKADPQNSNFYEANVNRLKIDLRNLDGEYKIGLGGCSEHAIITSHAAFGYLGETYGFTQIPIAGLSPDAEPSPKQLADIAKFAKDNNVKYIFFESLVSPKFSQTLASEVGAQTLVLDPIEGLTKEEIAQGGNYFTEMENNLGNLKIALKCK